MVIFVLVCYIFGEIMVNWFNSCDEFCKFAITEILCGVVSTNETKCGNGIF